MPRHRRRSRSPRNDTERVSRAICGFARHSTNSNILPDQDGHLSLDDIINFWGRDQGLDHAAVLNVVQKHSQRDNGQLRFTLYPIGDPPHYTIKVHSQDTTPSIRDAGEKSLPTRADRSLRLEGSREWRIGELAKCNNNGHWLDVRICGLSPDLRVELVEAAYRGFRKVVRSEELQKIESFGIGETVEIRNEDGDWVQATVCELRPLAVKFKGFMVANIKEVRKCYRIKEEVLCQSEDGDFQPGIISALNPLMVKINGIDVPMSPDQVKKRCLEVVQRGKPMVKQEERESVRALAQPPPAATPGMPVRGATEEF